MIWGGREANRRCVHLLLPVALLCRSCPSSVPLAETVLLQWLACLRHVVLKQTVPGLLSLLLLLLLSEMGTRVT
jgi:hypothetical protein